MKTKEKAQKDANETKLVQFSSRIVNLVNITESSHTKKQHDNIGF